MRAVFSRGLATAVQGFTIEEMQNVVSTFTLTVPLSALFAAPATFVLETVDVYDGVQLLHSRMLIEDWEFTLTQQKVLSVVFKGTYGFGHLTFHKAKSNAYYDDQTIAVILANLLSITPDWQLGDVSTLDGAIKCSVDLRVKATLWSQVIGLCEVVPLLFVRYGGYNTAISRHLLDVGTFNSPTGARIVQGLNLLTEVDVSASKEKPLQAIEGYGALITGSPFTVSLFDALTHTPSLATHPDFPIQLISGTGRTAIYEVVNNAVSIGGKEVRRYDSIKPINAGRAVVPASLNACGYALWQAVVKDLQKVTPATEYKMEAVFVDRDGNEILSPEISDAVFLYAKANDYVINRATGEQVVAQIFEINQLLRVIKISKDYAVKPVRWTLTLSDSDYRIEDDNSVLLMRKLEDNTTLDLGGSFIYPQVLVDAAPITHGPGVASDTTTSYGTAAKLFTFTPSGAPGTVDYFSYTILLDPVSYQYEISQQAELPATNLVIKVHPTGAAWGVGSTCEVNVQWIYM